MAGLKLICAIVAGTALAGCVTTSSLPEPAGTSPSDAAQYNMELGIAYLRQGKLQAAREKLERAIKEEPNRATAHAALGLVFERLEDPVGAEREYRRAVDLDSRDPDSLNALAVFLCSRKDEPKQALKLFDKAIEVPLSVKSANRVMLYTNAGTCAKQVDPVRAETYLRGALSLDPKFPDALLQLAEVTLTAGNAFQARGFFERYLAVTKPSAAGLWLGVRIEQALNDAVATQKYADELRKRFPDSVETRKLLEQSRATG